MLAEGEPADIHPHVAVPKIADVMNKRSDQLGDARSTISDAEADIEADQKRAGIAVDRQVESHDGLRLIRRRG
jgi:hypothetical protein